MNRPSSQNALAMHVETLTTKNKELAAALADMKQKYKELDKEYDILDDKNRDNEAALEEAERKMETLEEENAELKKLARISVDEIEEKG
jgi:predicted nuclease with TOPRIM domain